jgi:hypothetical protein
MTITEHAHPSCITNESESLIGNNILSNNLRFVKYCNICGEGGYSDTSAEKPSY